LAVGAIFRLHRGRDHQGKLSPLAAMMVNPRMTAGGAWPGLRRQSGRRPGGAVTENFFTDLRACLGEAPDIRILAAGGGHKEISLAGTLRSHRRP